MWGLSWGVLLLQLSLLLLRCQSKLCRAKAQFATTEGMVNAGLTAKYRSNVGHVEEVECLCFSLPFPDLPSFAVCRKPRTSKACQKDNLWYLEGVRELQARSGQSAVEMRSSNKCQREVLSGANWNERAQDAWVGFWLYGRLILPSR